MEKAVSTDRAAEEAKIHPVTLRRWLVSKSIRPKIQPSVATPMKGRTLWRWTEADVEKLRAYKAAHYRKGRGRKKVAVAEPEPAPRPRPASRPRPKAKRRPRRKPLNVNAAILDVVKGHPFGVGRDKIPAAVIERLGLEKMSKGTLQFVERSIRELALKGQIRIEGEMVCPPQMGTRK